MGCIFLLHPALDFATTDGNFCWKAATNFSALGLLEAKCPKCFNWIWFLLEPVQKNATIGFLVASHAVVCLDAATRSGQHRRGTVVWLVSSSAATGDGEPGVAGKHTGPRVRAAAEGVRATANVFRCDFLVWKEIREGMKETLTQI